MPIFCCCLAFLLPEILWEKPEGEVFSGKTFFVFTTDLPADDIIGMEIFVAGRAVAYLEASPFETFVDFGEFPSGQVEVRAVLRRFSGKPLVLARTITNLGHTLSEEVRLVRVPVLVDHADIESGGSFGVDDFVLTEDGRPQKLQFIMNRQDPLQLVILLDLSGSMSARIARVRKGLVSFLDRLAPDDAVKVVGFNHYVFQLTEFETDKEQLKKELLMLIPDGGTNLYAAIWSGARMLGQTNRRRAVFVFTDGRQDLEGVEEKILQKSADDAIELSRDLGVPIYIMGVGSEVEIREMNRIAALTGGRTFLLQNTKSMEDAFEGIARQLRLQYLLCYDTRAPRGGWHDIEVRLPVKPEALLRYPKQLYFK